MGMEVDDPKDRLSLAEAQYAATSTIFGSNDPVEILNALINFSGRPFAYAHMGLLDPETNTLTVIAVRDEKGVHDAHFQRRLDEYPGYEMLEAVEVLDIPDVTADPLLSDHERELVESRGMESLLLIPLVVSRRLSGLVAFENPTPVTLSQETLRAMRNLGNQIAVVFENQSLLRDTASTLEEVQTLYDINRAIIGALDPLDVLRVLRSYLAQNAVSIIHAVVERAGGAESVVVRHIISSAGEQTVELPIENVKRAADMFGEGESTGVLLVEDIDSAQASMPLRDLLHTGRVQSYLAILVREHGAIEDVIAIAFEARQAFDSRTQRLYSAVANQIGVVLQNQRLLQDAQYTAIQLAQQVRVLQAINQLSAGISTFQTEKDLLDYVAISLVDALDVSHVGIVVFEPGQETGIVISEYPDKGVVNTRIETRVSQTIAALREHPDRPVIIRDVGGNPLIEPETRPVLQAMGVLSMMIMPLQISGEIIGTVGFDLFQPSQQFTPELVATAATMLAQVAIGLQNIRLLSEAESRAEQLQRIALFGQSVQATLNLDAILDILLNEIPQLIPTQHIDVALASARQGSLRSVARYVGGRGTVDLVNALPVAVDGTFVGQVWQTQELLAIADTHALPVHPTDYDPAVRSLLIAPILSRGRVLGIVTIGSVLPYNYTETDQAIFQQMINQLAVALENAQAFEQSQRATKNEALINDISTQFQRRSAVEDMLEVALGELGTALGARRGRIRLTTRTDGERSEVES